MAVRLNTALRTTMAGAVDSTYTLTVYTGSQPATANDSPTGTQLVQITGIYFNAADSGAITLFDDTFEGTATATGTAGWARLTDGTNVIDGAVATSGSDFNLSTTSITEDDVVRLNSLTITMPAG